MPLEGRAEEVGGGEELGAAENVERPDPVRVASGGERAARGLRQRQTHGEVRRHVEGEGLARGRTIARASEVRLNQGRIRWSFVNEG